MELQLHGTFTRGAERNARNMALMSGIDPDMAVSMLQRASAPQSAEDDVARDFKDTRRELPPVCVVMLPKELEFKVRGGDALVRFVTISEELVEALDLMQTHEVDITVETDSYTLRDGLHVKAAKHQEQGVDDWIFAAE